MNPRFHNLYRKPYRAVLLYGVAGTLKLVREHVSDYVRGRRMPRGSELGPSAFDRTWNVRTDGNEDLSELNLIDDTNSLYGTRYEPTDPQMFRKVVDAVDL